MSLLDRIARPQVMLGLIAAYVTVHWALRLMLSPAFSVDEAEQMLFAQSLEWGYRFRHPPLVTWMVHGVQALAGLDRAAFFALKYLIMGAGLAAFYMAGRTIGGACTGALAVLGLVTTFVVGFLPHQDLMHTVVLTSAIGFALWAFAAGVTQGGLVVWAAFGIAAGLGVLSKYVFAILPAALLLAALSVPAMRARLAPAGLAIAGAIAAAIIAPYALWAIANEHSLFALSREITKADGGWLDPAGWIAGLFNLARAGAEFVLPFALIAFILVPRAFSRAAAPGSPREAMWRRVLLRTVLIALGLMALAVFAVGTEDFKARWLHQAMMPAILLLALRIPAAAPSPRAMGWLLGLVAIMAIAVVAARIAIWETNAAACKGCREYWPLADIAEELRAAGFSGGTIVADHHDLGGALRHALPDSRVIVPGYPLAIFPEPGEGGCLVIWKGADRPMPEAIARLFETQIGAAPPGGVQRLTVSLLKAPMRTADFAYVFAADGRGLCR